MKRLKLRAALIWLVLLTAYSTFLSAQAVATEKSSKMAAMSEARFITSKIENNEDAMFLSQQAINRAVEPRLQELAHQMLSDHTEMLYAMQELESAGTGSSQQNAPKTEADRSAAKEINTKLSVVSGAEFDSVWVSSILVMQKTMYDELSQAKETVMNPRLKMAITDAIPMVRKHTSQLTSLQNYLAKMAIQKRKLAAKPKKK